MKPNGGNMYMHSSISEEEIAREQQFEAALQANRQLPAQPKRSLAEILRDAWETLWLGETLDQRRRRLEEEVRAHGGTVSWP